MGVALKTPLTRTDVSIGLELGIGPSVDPSNDVMPVVGARLAELKMPVESKTGRTGDASGERARLAELEVLGAEELTGLIAVPKELKELLVRAGNCGVTLSDPEVETRGRLVPVPGTPEDCGLILLYIGNGGTVLLVPLMEELKNLVPIQDPAIGKPLNEDATANWNGRNVIVRIANNPNNRIISKKDLAIMIPESGHR